MAAGRGAVAFELVRTHSGASQHDPRRNRAGQKNPLRRGARPDTHPYQRKRPLAHGMSRSNREFLDQSACSFAPQCSTSRTGMAGREGLGL